MKCKEVQSLTMDFLYNEISEEDRVDFELHLSRCEECRKEVESLRMTSGILRQWEDEKPVTDIAPVRNNNFRFSRFIGSIINSLHISPRAAAGLAYGLIGIFLLLAVSNTEITLKNGDFSLSMGLFPRPVRQEARDDSYLIEKVDQLLNENIRLTGSLLEQSEKKQRRELAYLVSAVKEELERRRYQDMKLVGYGLNSIQENTNRQIRRIQQAGYSEQN